MRTSTFVIFACSSLFVTEFVPLVSCTEDSKSKNPPHELLYKTLILNSINDHLAGTNASAEFLPSRWVISAKEKVISIYVGKPRGWSSVTVSDPIITCKRGFFATSLNFKARPFAPVIIVEIELHLPEFEIDSSAFSLKGQWDNVNHEETTPFSIAYTNLVVPIEITVHLGERNGEFHWQIQDLHIDKYLKYDFKMSYITHLLKTYPTDFPMADVYAKLIWRVAQDIVKPKLFNSIREMIKKCSWHRLMFGQF